MRHSDLKPVRCFRSDRFFVVSGRWYFTTREGENFGPFGSREEAETRLAQYLETQATMARLRSAPRLPPGGAQRRHIARLANGLHRDAHPDTPAPERPL